MVKLLLEAGANVNQVREEDGRTALHVACDDASVELVDTLLSSAADPNVEDYAGWTPLHCAAYMGNPSCIELMIRRGAEVSEI